MSASISTPSSMQDHVDPIPTNQFYQINSNNLSSSNNHVIKRRHSMPVVVNIANEFEVKHEMRDKVRVNEAEKVKVSRNPEVKVNPEKVKVTQFNPEKVRVKSDKFGVNSEVKVNPEKVKVTQEDENLSQYELIRQRNIAERKALLEKLGFSKSKKTRKPQPAPKPRVTGPPRSSPRLAEMKRLKMKKELENRLLSLGSPPKRVKTRSWGPLSKRRDDLKDAIKDLDEQGYDEVKVKVKLDKIDNDEEEAVTPSKKRRRLSSSQSEERKDVGLVVEKKLNPDLTKVALDYGSKVYPTKNDQTEISLATTCHQCRQKTMDKKTMCKSGTCKGGIRGQFCGVCLRGRYGEDIVSAIQDPKWSCPACRGCCNCSFCRKAQGLPPTNQLSPFAKKKGYSSVRELLEKEGKELTWKNEQLNKSLYNGAIVISRC